MRQFLTIDTGGTKTRIVQFDDVSSVKEAYSASILHEIEIPTPHDKDEYIAKVAETIKQNFPKFCESPEENVVILATRGIVENDTVTDLPLGWESSPIAQDLSDALDGTRVLIENDAKLGALGVFPSDFHGRGLFVTIGTGIGAGLVIDGKLSRDLARTEVGLMRIEHEGKIATWEEFASGAAWFERSGGRTGYEMPADDPIWRWYAENLTVGMAILLPIFYPEIVIIGGKMAEFFDKYADDLRRIVAEHTWPPVAQVEITTAFDYHYVTNRGALVFGLKQMEKGDEN